MDYTQLDVSFRIQDLTDHVTVSQSNSQKSEVIQDLPDSETIAEM